MTITLPARVTEEGAVARLLLAASPGSGFKKYRDLAGNSFYTLNT
jgi:hypothetical protein